MHDHHEHTHSHEYHHSHTPMDAVACFEQGNGMLAEVLKELGAE